MYKEIWSVSLTSRTGVLACGPSRSAIPIWKVFNKTFLTPGGVQLQLSIVGVADWTVSIEARLARVGWTIFSVHVCVRLYAGQPSGESWLGHVESVYTSAELSTDNPLRVWFSLSFSSLAWGHSPPCCPQLQQLHLGIQIIRNAQ